MLMADDSPNLWPFEDFSAGDNDIDLSIDIESFWEILDESPEPEQNKLEDLSVGKDHQGESASDVGKNDNKHSLLRMGLAQSERTSSFLSEFAGSVTVSPSYNSEASDARVGVPNCSLESGESSVILDYGKQDASAQTGSPMHSCSGSLADWMLPVSGYDSFNAGSNRVFENVTSYSRDDSKENQYEQPNCSSTFSFAAGDANQASAFAENLNSDDMKNGSKFQFRGLDGDTNSKYGFRSPCFEKSDTNYSDYYGSTGNSFRTLGAPEIMEPSMMDMGLSVPWGDLHDSFNLHLMSNNSHTVTNIKEELEDLPTHTGQRTWAPMLEAQVEEPATLLGGSGNGGLNIKCEGNKLILPTGENSFTKTTDSPVCDEPPLLLNVASQKQIHCFKDDKNHEPVTSQGKPSASLDVIDDSLRDFSSAGNMFPANHSRQLLPIPSNSAKKLLVHAKDEIVELFRTSKRACHSHDNANGPTTKNTNPDADDHCPDVQASEQLYILPSSSMRKQLNCTEDERENDLIQCLSMDTNFSKGSCQTVQTTTIVNSFDDDSDVCIIEDLSDPLRPNQSSLSRKSIVASQNSTFSDPLNHMGMGGMKLRANDERLIFRVVLQDLSQPKTEASPPDGVLAVPLLRHQRIALSWMVQKETASLHCSGGILADDQGLGKTISTIALILKERAPSSRGCSDNLKHNERETLNLDEDDDCESEVDQTKQNIKSSQIISNGSSIKSVDARVQAKGRPAAGTLVVCPTSVLRQWAEELHNKVTSKANLSVLVYHGSNRTKDPLELAKYDVVITTYSIVSMEVPKQPLVDKDDDETGRQENCVPPIGLSSSKKRKYPPGSDKRSMKDKKGMDGALLESSARPLARVGWFRVVLDEAQSIKNHRTQVARACWGLRAKRRWCLSGTPIQNAVDDLYSYFRFLKYEPYAVYKSFCSTIKVPINRNPTNGYKKLQAVLKTIMLRRTKGTFLDGEPIINLPPKSVELRKVDFTDEERDFYCRLEADSRAQFAEYAAAGTVKQNYVNILLMLLRLRQACDHPLLVRGCSSSSMWRSSVEMAKKLSREKQVYLLNCLEASLAICSICNDPPEDAVVTSCGHVFCNQCICDHLTGDDNQCPISNCKARLSLASVLSREALKCSLSEQPDQDGTPNYLGPEVSDELQPNSWSHSFDSSKIKAALEVLQSLSKPTHCTQRTSSLKIVDGSGSCAQNSDVCISRGLDLDKLDNGKSDVNKDSNDSIEVAGEKAIVFSQWTRMLDLLETCLKNSSIQYRRLDGTMSVVARDKAVKDFNTLPEVSVMIMSLKAASLGLNMVAACHVLLLDLWWNPTTEDQAVDRAHRIGQTRPVTVLRLTVKDTVEDRILALQQKKREMVASAFGEDETGGHQTRLTVEDLKYLFMA